MGRTACTEPQCLYKGDLYHYLNYCATEVCHFGLAVMNCLCCGSIQPQWLIIKQIIPL